MFQSGDCFALPYRTEAEPIISIILPVRGNGAIMKNINLQDVFLNQARVERIPVTIFLTNGFQFKGIVRGFDSYIIVLDCDGKQNLVYKHAVSTIIPARQIPILDAASKEDASKAATDK